MRYLPLAGSHQWDPFWQTLVDGIKEKLQNEPVVRTRGKGVLRRLSKLRFVQNNFRDERGEPLFRDLDPEVYLSDVYEKDDILTLRTLGVRRLFMKDFIATAKQDLAGSESRLKSPTASSDWQSRASNALLIPWAEGWEGTQAELRDLPLIPLQDGSWVSAVDGNDLLYGNIDAIQIPSGLGLNLIATWAAAVPERRQLFDKLGVKQADFRKIRSQVLDLHAQGKRIHWMRTIEMVRSVQDLTFLYLTHWAKAEDEPAPQLSVFDEGEVSGRPSDYDIYIRTADPYGAQSLLLAIENPKFVWKPAFLHPQYFGNPPATPEDATLDWAEWLQDYVGLRREIPLLDWDNESLSAECLYMTKPKNPQKPILLRFLKHVWPKQGHIVANSEAIQQELRALRVQCTNGKRMPLGACFMPLGELRKVCHRFTDEKILPFLSLGLPRGKDAVSDDAKILSEWSFLTKVLGIQFENDLEFRLCLLSVLLKRSLPCPTIQLASKLLELYRYIDAWIMGAENPEAARATTRSVCPF